MEILEYLDKKLNGKYNLDEPWDSEHNQKLLDSLPSYYQHFKQDSELSFTCYVTFVGPDTATGNGETPRKSTNGARAILVTEAITDIPWTKPEDAVVTKNEKLPLLRPQPDGWNVFFGNGTIHFVSSGTSKDVVHALIIGDSKELKGNEHGAWEKKAESKPILDASSILRRILIPTDFASEGAGWERFGISDDLARPNVNNYNVSGPLQKLPAVIQDNRRKNDVLTALANEVEDLLAQHPEWKAGVDDLGYLQAELGNESQAVALFE